MLEVTPPRLNVNYFGIKVAPLCAMSKRPTSSLRNSLISGRRWILIAQRFPSYSVNNETSFYGELFQSIPDFEPIFPSILLYLHISGTHHYMLAMTEAW